MIVLAISTIMVGGLGYYIRRQDNRLTEFEERVEATFQSDHIHRKEFEQFTESFTLVRERQAVVISKVEDARVMLTNLIQDVGRLREALARHEREGERNSPNKEP